ncbi:16S rRNA (cytosine(967)-C(5))-methyltransferase RsmB [Reinekea marina]|uniref:16S rRNA (cytosine(967)-C(5))-methyltransferase n=1 Tax=Reinekea marina TaxID=1310421 RepID=A0ABV7WPA1_9GAMM|nr:16S rRNA (cytosine(967)-C(5))-methyltransferase RsmB [Reinekea marina]MDN3647741.1 16S rRNA (cytosine(967)-C(5))-methyltransferase RsmB [Reinekea marina]
MSLSTRLAAADTLYQMVEHGRSLNDLIPANLEKLDIDQHPFYQQLVYGATRYYFALDEIASLLLEKPIKEKERLVHMLLLVGVYQLWKLEVADHAALNETVQAAVDSKKQWAKPLLNATLRRFQREKEQITADLRRRDSFPGWLNKRLRKAYPDHWQDICQQSNQLGPMTLRVNQRHHTRDAWLALADEQGLECQATEYSPVGIHLAAPAPVFALPGFEQGQISVQDEAAQMCATLLNVQDGEKVLDACAAPGGKTGHLLESANIDLIALDVDERRLTRVEENLSRIGLAATLTACDAGDLAQWWNGEAFDAVLLDAPCSGTGVIRRHPDIKLLRKSADITALAKVQKNLLEKLWSTVKPGGRLLYATCSILPDENSDQVVQFLANHADAELLALNLKTDVACEAGVQWLPRSEGHDGFYFALLHKKATEQ